MSSVTSPTLEGEGGNGQELSLVGLGKAKQRESDRAQTHIPPLSVGAESLRFCRQSLDWPGGGVGRDSKPKMPHPHSSANELQPGIEGWGRKCQFRRPTWVPAFQAPLFCHTSNLRLPQGPLRSQDSLSLYLVPILYTLWSPYLLREAAQEQKKFPWDTHIEIR